MSNKLKIKDLVTTGIFFVIYFVVMFAVGMIGLVPILFLIYPSILGIVTGTIILLYMAKVAKPWALFISFLERAALSLLNTMQLPLRFLIVGYLGR